ncbi:MAG TPA: hypothetical protein VLH16_08005, partial [Bacteroidales bacterium]|nr:hypothetical protein [Bacteroidales bacterium]
RFFTTEFFQTVDKRLNPNGVLALSLPSLPRAQLLAEGLAAMSRSIYATLKEVFRYVRVFPGEGSNIFIASNTSYIMYTSASSMSRKIEAKGIDVTLLNQPYLEHRTLPWWSENFYASIYNWETAALNKDFEPGAVFESMLYFSEMFTPGIAVILDAARNYGRYILIAGFLAAVIMVAFLRRRGDVPFAIFTTGFAGMLLDLIIIFAFQAIFGYVFYWIGILVSVFMAGAALAALKITNLLPTLKNPVNAFVKTDIAVLAFCIVIPFMLIVLHNYTFNGIPVVLSKSIFVVMSFACGMLVGSQYPLACHILKAQGKGEGRTAGLLYGLDLFGGWFGGVLGGLLLLPLLGLFDACLVLAGVKLFSVVLIFISRRKNG